MGWSLVGTPGTGSATSGTSLVTTIPATTLGNVLVLCYGANPANATISGSPSGGGVATWNLLIANNTNRATAIWWGIVTTGGSTSVSITAANAYTGSGGLTNISEWTPTAGVVTTDGTATANSGTNATTSTGTVTLTGSDSIVFAVERGAHTVYSSGPTNSFTGLTSPTPGSGNFAYKIPGAVGAQNTTWTYTTSTAYTTVIGALTILSLVGASVLQIGGGINIVGPRSS